MELPLWISYKCAKKEILKSRDPSADVDRFVNRKKVTDI
jgi:hypothetical protein